MAISLSSTTTQGIYHTNIVSNTATMDASSNKQQKQVHNYSIHTSNDVVSSIRSNHDLNLNAISTAIPYNQSELQYSGYDTQYDSHQSFPSIDLLYNLLGKIPQPLQHTWIGQYDHEPSMSMTSHCIIESNMKYPNPWSESKPSIAHNYTAFSRLPSVNNEANVQKSSLQSVYVKNTTTSTSRSIVPSVNVGDNMNGSYDNVRNPSAFNVQLDDQDESKSMAHMHYYWDCCEWTHCAKYGLTDAATMYWDESSWLSMRPNLVIIEPKSIETILFLGRLPPQLSLIYMYTCQNIIVQFLFAENRVRVGLSTNSVITVSMSWSGPYECST